MTIASNQPSDNSFFRRIFDDTSAKIATALVGGVYVLGYIVTTLNNAYYGFYDSGLLHPRVVTAGIALLVSLAAPYYLVTFGVPLLPRLQEEMERHAQRRSILGIVVTALTSMTFGCSFLAMISAELFEVAHQRNDIWQTVLYSSLVLMVVSGLQAWPARGERSESFPWNSRTLDRTVWTLVLICTGYVVHLGLSNRVGSVAFRWLWLVSMAIYMMGLNFTSLEKIKDHPWLRTLVGMCLFVSSFARYVYPAMKPFWGGSPEPVIISFDEKAGVTQRGPLKSALVQQTDQGFYFLFGNATHATFIPRGAVQRIDY